VISTIGSAGRFGAAGHVLDGLVDPLAVLDLLEVQAAPGDAVVADPEDGDAPDVEACPIAAGALPVPLGPPGVANLLRPEEFGPEVGHAGKDRGPVAADLLAADKGPVGMHRLLAAVARVEAGDEGVQVVTVLGVTESLDHLGHHSPRLPGKGPVSPEAPTMDRRSWVAKGPAAAKPSTGPSWGREPAVDNGAQQANHLQPDCRMPRSELGTVDGRQAVKLPPGSYAWTGTS
jgi:hypothetical protein